MRNTGSIGLFLITFLSVKEFLTEVSVKFVKINDKVPSSVGADINFGADGDVRVIALISEERRHTSRSIRSVVVGKFGNRENSVPVVLLVGSVDPNVLLQGLVDSPLDTAKPKLNILISVGECFAIWADKNGQKKHSYLPNILLGPELLCQEVGITASWLVPCSAPLGRLFACFAKYLAY